MDAHQLVVYQQARIDRGRIEVARWRRFFEEHDTNLPEALFTLKTVVEYATHLETKIVQVSAASITHRKTWWERLSDFFRCDR